MQDIEDIEDIKRLQVLRPKNPGTDEFLQSIKKGVF